MRVLFIIAAVVINFNQTIACGAGGCKPSETTSIAGEGWAELLCCGLPVLFLIVYLIYDYSKKSKTRIAKK